MVLRPLFCLFFSGSLRQISLFSYCFVCLGIHEVHNNANITNVFIFIDCTRRKLSITKPGQRFTNNLSAKKILGLRTS